MKLNYEKKQREFGGKSQRREGFAGSGAWAPCMGKAKITLGLCEVIFGGKGGCQNPAASFFPSQLLGIFSSMVLYRELAYSRNYRKPEWNKMKYLMKQGALLFLSISLFIFLFC